MFRHMFGWGPYPVHVSGRGEAGGKRGGGRMSGNQLLSWACIAHARAISSLSSEHSSPAWSRDIVTSLKACPQLADWNRPATSRPSYTARSLVTRVGACLVSLADDTVDHQPLHIDISYTVVMLLTFRLYLLLLVSQHHLAISLQA